MRATYLALPLTLALLSVPTSAQHDQRPQGSSYVVTDLGSLGGGFSLSYGINNRNHVGGMSTFAGGRSEAYLWTRERGMEPLGTLFGGSNSGAGGPTESDIVPIISDTDIPDPDAENFCGFGTPFICIAGFWNRGITTALPTLFQLSNQGGSNTENTGSNARGEIVGFAENGVLDSTCASATPGLRFDFEAVLWNEKHRIQVLHPLPGDTVGFALSINESGDAVGASGPCSDTPLFPLATGPHAVLWERGGRPIAIPGLGGTRINTATSINDSGEVLGASSLAGDATVHAYLWSRPSHRSRDLGTVDGDQSSLPAAMQALNNRGQAVGTSCASADPIGDLFSGLCRAFLWRENAMTDLNSLVTLEGNPSHLYMFLAFGINDRSAITGWAFTPNGEVHAFVATPVSRE